jgi:hypothetical protein
MLALSVVGASVLLAGSATAAKVTNVKSKVTITSGEATEFTGKVTAGNKKCVRGRKVKLFMEPSGAKDELVGIAMTNSAGNWEMKGRFLAGIYHAQVTGSNVDSPSATYHCLPDVGLSLRF